MAHAAKKDFRILMLERRERPAKSILGPALGIGLLGILEEAIEGAENVGR
ncbi:MAG TPA: hypothetical protein VMB66_04815 [Candidatus Acidoferrales bacterium]|nr:hypothetical protein [Candidatus Acidoferrales bacterium]